MKLSLYIIPKFIPVALIYFIISFNLYSQKQAGVSISEFKEIEQKRITDIEIDKSGNKWFGTEYGIYKYADTVTHYNRSTYPDLKDNHISCIYASDNIIYFGSYNSSVIILDSSYKFSYIDLSLIIPDNREFLVSKIFQKDNYLWIVLHSKGIARYDLNTKKEAVFFEQNDITDFAIDEQNINWIGTSNGLLYSNNLADKPEKYEKIKGEITKIDYINNTLFVASYFELESKLWLHLSCRKWKKIKIDKSIISYKISDIIVDKNSAIWIASRYVGSYNRKWKVYTNPEYKSEMALCLKNDKENNIWVGTEGKGVYLFKSNKSVINNYIDILQATAIKNKLSDKEFQGKKIEINKKIEVSNLFFGANEYSLSDRSKTILDEILLILYLNPNYKLLIEGHTAKPSPDQIEANKKIVKINKELSKKRALSVQDYLIEKGIDKSRLKSKGYGARKLKDIQNPLSSINRRIEITFIDK